MTHPLDRRPAQTTQAGPTPAPPSGAWRRSFPLWENRPSPGGPWWRRLFWWWKRESRDVLTLDNQGLQHTHEHAERASFDWQTAWRAQLCVWPISAHYLELGVVLVSKGGEALARGQRVAFRVVLPQSCVSKKVPVQQRADPFLDTADFGALWTILSTHAQIHGEELGERVVAPTDRLPRWDVAGKQVARIAPESGFKPTAVVPAGTYTIGSPPRESKRDPDETHHEVRIRRPFEIQTTPVTNGQWTQLMKSAPSKFPDDRHPVEQVSWFQAVAYCNALSRSQGLPEVYELTEVRGAPGDAAFWARVKWADHNATGWRLPTEAEWEIACRAGNTAPTYGMIKEIAWTKVNSPKQTQPVGLKIPNAWGLYDMLGNVWEWCWDHYGPYATEGVVDPIGPKTGPRRTIRGGCWNNYAYLARAANRGFGDPDITDASIGFRCARTLHTTRTAPTSA